MILLGLCAFNGTYEVMAFCMSTECIIDYPAGATQVKWNRQDGNILASSHMNEVLIWDKRVRQTLFIVSTHSY